MSLFHSPSLVTSGLVLCLDAGNSKSYPGSGTTWTDLSGRGNHGTLVNGPTYNSANGGAIVFDGVDDTVAIPAILNAYPFTVIAAVSHRTDWDSSNRMDQILNMSIAGQRVSCGITDSWQPAGAVTLMYGGSNHWTCNPPSTIGPDSWHQLAWTVIGSNNADHKIYIDGVSQTLINNGGAHGGAGAWNLGNNNGGSEGWRGSINSVIIYNRALSAAEVQQNFNALRGRYGV